jgi:hypothetical protein
LILANFFQEIAFSQREQQPEAHRFIKSRARNYILQPQNFGLRFENRQHLRRMYQRFNYVIAAMLGAHINYSFPWTFHSRCELFFVLSTVRR